jgi:hypothetical protein
MERDRVDRLGVASVVLNELVGSNVPDFDGRVGGASRYERARRVKGHAVYVAIVFVEGVYALFGVAVPQSDSFVVRGAHDQTSIVRESEIFSNVKF